MRQSNMLIWKSYITFFLIINLAAGEIINKGWWKNIVFYHAYPRSFMDFNNDGIGDLKGGFQDIYCFFLIILIRMTLF
jgi:hypothetical protein